MLTRRHSSLPDRRRRGPRVYPCRQGLPSMGGDSPMEGAWLVSYLALWLLTVILGVVVLAHSRLLGLLHYRLGPSGARPLADGPELGSTVTHLEGRTLDGTAWSYSFPSPREVLVVFVSP